MRKLMGFVVAGFLVTSVTVAMAAEKKAKPAKPTPDAVGAGVVPLYICVKYKDLDNIAPCAVPKIVQVLDPCQPVCDPCKPCCKPAPRCVNVQICVPQTCCPPKVVCRRGGKYVKYDYGKYAVEIRVKRGYIEVDYDD